MSLRIRKATTLDILLTKSFSYIKDLKIIDTERYCISDHLATTFVITETIKRKPLVKRKCYNYKNTNWDMLNETLDMIDWDNLLDYSDPETAGQILKKFFVITLMTIFPNLPLRLSTNPPGLIPSATPNARKKTNCIKTLNKRKP